MFSYTLQLHFFNYQYVNIARPLVLAHLYLFYFINLHSVCNSCNLTYMFTYHPHKLLNFIN